MSTSVINTEALSATKRLIVDAALSAFDGADAVTIARDHVVVYGANPNGRKPTRAREITKGNAGRRPPSVTAQERIRDRLIKNIGEPVLSQKELAKMAGCSEYTVRSHEKKGRLTNISPHRYYKFFRLSEAERWSREMNG